MRVDSRLGLPRVVPTMELMAGLAGPTTPDRSSAQGMQVNHMELPCNAQIHNALKSFAIFGMGGSNCWNLEPTSPYPEQTDGRWIYGEVLTQQVLLALRRLREDSHHREMENYRPGSDAAHAQHAYDARFSQRRNVSAALVVYLRLARRGVLCSADSQVSLGRTTQCEPTVRGRRRVERGQVAAILVGTAG